VSRKEIITIYSVFNNLKSDKQEVIINAAIKEFVQSGFEKASTNDIVKRANISKGSLVNYFNNKKDLYTYLIKHSIQIIEEMYEQNYLSQTELCNRIEKIVLQNLHIQQRFPRVFDYLDSTILDESYEVKQNIKQKLDPI